MWIIITDNVSWSFLWIEVKCPLKLGFTLGLSTGVDASKIIMKITKNKQPTKNQKKNTAI